MQLFNDLKNLHICSKFKRFVKIVVAKKCGPCLRTVQLSVDNDTKNTKKLLRTCKRFTILQIVRLIFYKHVYSKIPVL